MRNRFLVISLFTLLAINGYCQTENLGIVNDINLVNENGKLGLVYNNGDYAVKPDKYTKIEYDQRFDLYKCYKGKYFEICFDNSEKVKSDYLFTHILGGDKYSNLKVKGKDGVGYVKDKKIMIPPIYDKIDEEVETYFESTRNYILFKKGKKGLFVNGTIALDVEYDEFVKNSNTQEFITIKNKKKGLVYPNLTKDGKITELLPTEYYSINHIDDIDFEGASLYLVSKEGMYGIYSIGENEFVIPLKYKQLKWRKRKQIEDFDSYIIPFKSNYLIITFNDSTAIETKEVIYIPENDTSVFFKNSSGKYQLCNIDYKLSLMAYEYDEVKIFEESNIALKSNNKWWLIDSMLELVLEKKHNSYDDLVKAFERRYD